MELFEDLTVHFQSTITYILHNNISIQNVFIIVKLYIGKQGLQQNHFIKTDIVYQFSFVYYTNVHSQVINHSIKNSPKFKNNNFILACFDLRFKHF